MTIYLDSIQKFFNKIVNEEKNSFLEAFWEGQEEQFNQILSKILKNTISYYDNKEAFYHGFLVGIFVCFKGYKIKSNQKTGDGRADIIIYDKIKSKVAVIELKIKGKSSESLENLAQIALKQIAARHYATEYLDCASSIRCWGISFYQKNCLARCN